MMNSSDHFIHALFLFLFDMAEKMIDDLGR